MIFFFVFLINGNNWRISSFVQLKVESKAGIATARNLTQKEFNVENSLGKAFDLFGGKLTMGFSLSLPIYSTPLQLHFFFCFNSAQEQVILFQVLRVDCARNAKRCEK